MIKRFSTRLNLAIVVVVTLVYAIMVAVFYNYMYGKLGKETLRRADYVFTLMDLQVEKVISASEYTMEYFSDEIQRNLDQPEEIQHILHNVISLNPEVMYSTLAFRPGSHAKKGRYYALVSRREGSWIRDTVVITDAEDYLSSQWYVTPLRTGKDSWCNLHINKEDSTRSYISLVSPIVREVGQPPEAVFMTRVSLRWLVGMINEKNPFENSVNVLTDGKKIGIAYNVSNGKLWHGELKVDAMPEDSENRFLSWRERPYKAFLETDDVSVSLRDGEYYFTFSFDMPFEGWQMLVICPADDLFGELKQTAVIVGLIGLLGLLLLCLFSTRTINRMTRPLNELSESARLIAQGNFTSPLPVIASGDEMQELGDSFRHMQSSLIHYMEELKRTTMDKQRIESELAIAHRIQMGMIPKTFPPFPEREDVDIYAMMRPAREVGGDLYDYFIEDEKLYFIIGDVSGKGVPASLLMAMVRSLFRSVSHQKDTPSEIVSQINRSVIDTNVNDMFVTLFVGILDLTTGTMRFCDAGHNPFVLMSGSGCSFMEMRPNLPVAVMSDYPYVAECISLSDATLLFYTDGLTEAENEREAFYGDARLLETASSLWDESPMEVTHRITASVETFVGNAEQSDDLTILTIRYKRRNVDLQTNHELT